MEKKGELCEGRAERGGYTHRRSQIHGFDICVLLDSLPRARLSCPPPPPLSCFCHLPIGQLWKREREFGRGHREKTDSFSLDVLQCEACRDTFKDEAGVNVVGRMTEPL